MSLQNAHFRSTPHLTLEVLSPELLGMMMSHETGTCCQDGLHVLDSFKLSRVFLDSVKNFCNSFLNMCDYFLLTYLLPGFSRGILIYDKLLVNQ